MTDSAEQQAFYRAMAQLDRGEPLAAAETCRAALAGAADDVDLLALMGRRCWVAAIPGRHWNP